MTGPTNTGTSVAPNSPAAGGVMSRLRTRYRCSPLTRYGRALRRRAREPLDPGDYVEVYRPTRGPAMTTTTYGACGVKGCTECLPLYDEDNRPLPRLCRNCGLNPADDEDGLCQECDLLLGAS